MRRYSRSVTTLAILTAVTLYARGGTVTAEQDLSAQDSVPAIVGDAANGIVGDFVYALTGAGRSVGLVMRRNDSDLTITLRHFRERLEEPQDRVPLNQALQQFAVRHKGFAVSRDDSVVRIAEKDLSGTAESVLERWVGALEIKEERVDYAFAMLQQQIDPTIKLSRGSVGSFLGEVGKPQPPPEFPIVSVNVPIGTFGDGLDSIVRAAPGTAWILAEEQEGPFASLTIIFKGNLRKSYHVQLW